MSDDVLRMRAALDEARKGIGRTAPNPPVGAVIVKDGVVLGKGWHRKAGEPHSEREALADARGKDVRGSTIYVTLEPCSTHGRTPPCTQGLIEAGVKRVVYACVDRNPDHAGRADELLTAAGIEVVSGVCADEAEKILRPFFKVRETGLPWVIWKTAMSLDGRITRPPGEGQWLTGDLARADVQKLRSTVDAILTSGETVRRDNPALTIRVPELLEGRTQPWRVVATDKPETMPSDAPLFSDEWKERTLIRPRHDLEKTLRGLVKEQGVLTVMVEAGGVFSAALFEAGLVDEAVIYYAPILCGGPSPGLAGNGLRESLKMEEVEFRQLGNDVRVSGLVK
ncbi:bifunctional diaminohydroxyphosphoribosylaminopyrimidine deaminase/5-amino-6-(5-phosphoribosylamino)uracil reductase RibD [Luteolibacter yonseiensis]|uniref:Riboflavin biosynthesis protein RibD n=1 Tax=Luteolibacter yonseiensis TaxID=1144680 RepID=A0A934VAA3_9BACT|nr:bifunctional diaminohydroxyphosphoribosylaminopyrimidine deaminase/5-amino-6-(5-phosphoribosylamino)uracil reductase RibD [Luteolibacter yonseiensis]MBK1816008.1 bifunctional diaminohydroxyphosphoribosylaminopyrimidine deaminase/5-amino-6-(5-phosphoribosylamino)uracil reductase RibD [Luteolibacter yonseiensis]